MATLVSPYQESSKRSRPSTPHSFQPTGRCVKPELEVCEEQEQHEEAPARSLAKALSWRLVALSVTVSVAWFLTGDTTFAATIGAADTAIKIGAYYMHERTWLKIDFGKPKK